MSVIQNFTSKCELMVIITNAENGECKLDG